MAYVQVEADDVSTTLHLRSQRSEISQRLEEGPEGLQFKSMP